MDFLSADVRSRLMARIKSKNSKAEISVRSCLHAMGYRFCCHPADLHGKPDIVFRRLKRAIFVNGCFWHCHPGCRGNRIPKSRHDYWLPKLQGNVSRDTRNLQTLEELGWRVLVVWECEIRDMQNLCSRLKVFMEDAL